MYQKLMTKELQAKLPKLYSTENVPNENKVVVARYFHPLSHYTWYATEYDPEKKLFFGLVDGDEKEWGYFSLAEMQGVRVKGLGIERDMHFKPQKIKDIKELSTSPKPEVATEGRKSLALEWDDMHVQARQEVLRGAGFNLKLANEKWADLQEYERLLLAESLTLRSGGKVTLNTSPPPQPKPAKEADHPFNKVVYFGGLPVTYGTMVRLLEENAKATGKADWWKLRDAYLAGHSLGKDAPPAGTVPLSYEEYKRKTQSPAKEPWEMTREEFRDINPDDLPDYEYYKKMGWPEGHHYDRESSNYRYATSHLGWIKTAIHKGKTVPDYNLQRYPVLLEDSTIEVLQPKIYAHIKSLHPELAKKEAIEEKAKAMGLSDAQIKQAKREGVTTELGLRRIEKNTREDTSNLERIQANRPLTSQIMDVSQSHHVTVSPDSPRVKVWVRDQGQMDVEGIDTPNKEKQTKLKAMKTPKFKRPSAPKPKKVGGKRVGPYIYRKGTLRRG